MLFCLILALVVGGFDYIFFSFLISGEKRICVRERKEKGTDCLMIADIDVFATSYPVALRRSCFNGVVQGGKHDREEGLCAAACIEIQEELQGFRGGGVLRDCEVVWYVSSALRVDLLWVVL